MRTSETVLEAIQEVCTARDWQLVAAHIRSTHVHCVVDGIGAQMAIADFKAYSSRALNRAEGYQKRWAREGSTRRLPNSAAVAAAVSYVVDGQGDAMAVYVSSPRPDGTGL